MDDVMKKKEHKVYVKNGVKNLELDNLIKKNSYK